MNSGAMQSNGANLTDQLFTLPFEPFLPSNKVLFEIRPMSG